VRRRTCMSKLVSRFQSVPAAATCPSLAASSSLSSVDSRSSSRLYQNNCDRRTTARVTRWRAMQGDARHGAWRAGAVHGRLAMRRSREHAHLILGERACDGRLELRRHALLDLVLGAPKHEGTQQPRGSGELLVVDLRDLGVELEGRVEGGRRGEDVWVEKVEQRPQLVQVVLRRMQRGWWHEHMTSWQNMDMARHVCAGVRPPRARRRAPATACL
jgi:hypothetical protein